jgi:hypothetical protein
VSWLVLRASVHRLRETWHQESAAPEQPRWVEIFSHSDFWQTVFHWNKSRTLDRNPMAWLQEYSWTARLTKWGWFVVLLVAEFVAFSADTASRSVRWQFVVTGALALGVAFSAVGSFRREQESGLLELLLVTPLSVRQLLGGRVWGICCHYLPALIALWFGWNSERLLNIRPANAQFMVVLFPNPLAFIAMMVLGLYLALGKLNFFLAWLLTWALAFVLPLWGTIAAQQFAGVSAMAALRLQLLFQVGLTAVMWFLLQRAMSRRAFVVAKTERGLLA